MKRRIFKITGYLVLILIIAVAGLLTYVKTALPSIPVEDIHVGITPERIARGSYLFNTLAGCVNCHSEREGNLLTMPVKEGTEGEGGETFNQKLGFPGSYTAKNLTPFHLGNWTDGEIFRAITSGVSKDGHPLFPIMPYQEYGKADKEDIFSLIAYLRTLTPVKKEIPPSVSDFPMDFIIHTIPAKADLHPIPEKKDSVNYGRYLVNMASCRNCHTQFEKGKFKEGMDFAGGRQMSLPTGGLVSTANITPDNETGIGSWSRDIFIQRFHTYGDSSFHPNTVEKGNFNTIMPWTRFGKMTSTDLSAIYDYLRTITPVKNTVIKFQKQSIN